MLKNSKVESNENEILNYYKQNYTSKFCREITFEDILDEKSKKEYQKFIKKCCCVKPLSLLIYSIIILAIACGGFFFAISRNEGYKAYKEILERNISLINNGYPDEKETSTLISFLKMDKNDSSCTYIKYSYNLCSYTDYKQYCTPTNYQEKKCNYMDRQINKGIYFV